MLGASMGGWPSDLTVLKAHSGDVLSIAFRPDGKQIVTASSDGEEL